MKYSRYLKLMSEGNTMNDAIAMMFSILIVMFGYLVFKILTDQSQPTTTSTGKRSKKKGTGKPVIKNNWNMRPLDTKDPALQISDPENLEYFDRQDGLFFLLLPPDLFPSEKETAA